MLTPPVIQLLTGDRLHLSHGPIDIVLKAWGTSDNIHAAYDAAARRFPEILPELCDELSQLRTAVRDDSEVSGPVANRMLDACRPFADAFITPMAAVAGAVADELLAYMTAASRLERAFVNDGGDIAVHVTEGHALDVGIAGVFPDGTTPALNGETRIEASSGIGGIATSGARGRSFSLGIADSVTVLAGNAATADAAATLIANAVDFDSPAIRRQPARLLDPDTDLGDLPVTVSVGRLQAHEVGTALERGMARAREYRMRGLICGAALMLAGATRSLSSDAQKVALAP
jgi:ApbE superfamily uncharacterized protein (UPF0280 family)